MVEVPAGGTAEVPVHVGTTACGEDGPPGLPPGEYDAVVVVSTDPGTPAPAGSITGRARLEVVG